MSSKSNRSEILRHGVGELLIIFVGAVIYIGGFVCLFYLQKYLGKWAEILAIIWLSSLFVVSVIYTFLFSKRVKEKKESHARHTVNIEHLPAEDESSVQKKKLLSATLFEFFKLVLIGIILFAITPGLILIAPDILPLDIASGLIVVIVFVLCVVATHFFNRRKTDGETKEERSHGQHRGND